MSVPTFTVEVAFVSDPLDTTPTWTDISQYVRMADRVRIVRGRDSELVEFSAGKLNLVLNNRDRRFDPSYAAGPYFGNLKPGKPIRVRATWNAVTYDVFSGFINGWPQRLAKLGRDATVPIEAVDGLAWLAAARLPSDLVFDVADGLGSLSVFLRRTSEHLWLDETAATNGAYLVYGARKSGGTLLPGSATSSIEFDGATVWGLDTPFASGAGPWSVAFTMSTTQTVETGSPYGVICGALTVPSFTGGSGSQIVVYNGQLGWWGRASPLDFNDGVNTVQKVNDGKPHHVVVTGTGAGTQADVTIYIDGVQAAVTLHEFSDGYGQMGVAHVGDGMASPGENPDRTNFNGSVQDLACYPSILTADQVATLYQYTSGYLEETAYARLTRVLSDAGWPATWVDFDADTANRVCGKLVYDGVRAIDQVRLVERTEQGRVFATAANDIRFIQRYHATEETRGNTVQVTFSDDGADVGYTTFGFDYSRKDIQNDITVIAQLLGVGGPTPAALRATDVTSVTEHNPRAVQIDTALTRMDLALGMATGLVIQRKDPQYRLDPILVKRIPDALWDNVLGLELGDRISVENTPMDVGSQNVQEQLVEQIVWSLGKTQWDLTIAGSPAPPDFFVVGSSLVGGADLIGY